MCGFLAVINPKKKDIPYLKERLEDLHHRGPDSNGIYNNQSCFLGFKRLVIIDSNKRSDQPFTKKHHHLVYNGEIYNYLELIKEHKLQVTTKSDT
jgi:asparagine synthase (glutamine-hydrolysing)